MTTTSTTTTEQQTTNDDGEQILNFDSNRNSDLMAASLANNNNISPMISINITETNLKDVDEDQDEIEDDEFNDEDDEIVLDKCDVSKLKIYGDDDDNDDDDYEDYDDDYGEDEEYARDYVFTKNLASKKMMTIKTSNNRKINLKRFFFSKTSTNDNLNKKKFLLNNIKEDDKDSLVGTSASDEELDSIIYENCIKSTPIQDKKIFNETKSKSHQRCSLSSKSSSNNKKVKKCRNQLYVAKAEDRQNPKLKIQKPELNQSLRSNRCYGSDVLLESDDHYCYTTDATSTNSSQDNLTLSPLPSLSSCSLTSIPPPISYLPNSSSSSSSSPIMEISSSSLSISRTTTLNNTNTNQHFNKKTMISLSLSSSSPPPPPPTPHQSYLRSSTLASIRDAVSHLTRLDDFNVVKLSQGFFSQVFKVTHLPTGKIMVLKMNKNPGNRGNALKEIELLNKLNHPNIVAYMGTVVHEGALHPLLEYINGGTLEQLIHKYYPSSQRNQLLDSCSVHNNNVDDITDTKFKQHQRRYFDISSPKVHRLKNPDKTFMKLMQDVCHGMAYLHSQGYLHRDLASKNIFIRKHLNDLVNFNRRQEEHWFEGSGSNHESSSSKDMYIFDDNRLEAVIGDFGFATGEPTTEQKLSIVGSPYWLGPECLQNKWYNHKCDIFSFGVICCELNWRTPSDPDFLPRCDNYAIDFAKLSNKKDTLLARVAMMACQYEPEKRPEFHELFKIFNRELQEEDLSSKKLSETEIQSCHINPVDNYDYSPRLPSSKIVFPKVTFKRFNSLDNSNLLRPNGHGNNNQPESEVDDVFEQHLQRRRHSALIQCHNLATLALMMEMDINSHQNHNER